MFFVNQNVWCLIYGQGEIITQEGDTLKVVFRDGKSNSLSTYTLSGELIHPGLPKTVTLFASKPTIHTESAEDNTKGVYINAPGLCNILIDNERIHTLVYVTSVNTKDGLKFRNTRLNDDGEYLPYGDVFTMDYVPGIEFETFTDDVARLIDLIGEDVGCAVFKFTDEDVIYVADDGTPFYPKGSMTYSVYDPETYGTYNIPLINADGAVRVLDYALYPFMHFVEDQLVCITTKNGKVYTGPVRKETANAIILVDYHNNDFVINRVDIEDTDEL